MELYDELTHAGDQPAQGRGALIDDVTKLDHGRLFRDHLRLERTSAKGSGNGKGLPPQTGSLFDQEILSASEVGPQKTSEEMLGGAPAPTKK